MRANSHKNEDNDQEKSATFNEKQKAYRTGLEYRDFLATIEKYRKKK